jgi:hypothetical protein
MTKTFFEILHQWQVFYATLAAVCATLTGLLFVALSLNVDVLRSEGNDGFMLLARLTFGEFLGVLMVSLVFLIPHQVPFGIVVALLTLGVTWTVSTLLTFKQRIRAYGFHPSPWYIRRAFVLTLIGSLGIVGIGIAILYGKMNALYWLVLMLAAQLTSACLTAWFLLVQVRDKGLK